MTAIILHLVLVALVVISTILGDHARDVRFMTQPHTTVMAQVVSKRALFPRGAQYDEVTVRKMEGSLVVLDTPIPQWSWLNPRHVGTIIKVNCLRQEPDICRPPGFYFSAWRVMLAYGPLILILLSLLVHVPSVQHWMTQRVRGLIDRL